MKNLTNDFKLGYFEDFKDLFPLLVDFMDGINYFIVKPATKSVKQSSTERVYSLFCVVAVLFICWIVLDPVGHADRRNWGKADPATVIEVVERVVSVNEHEPVRDFDVANVRGQNKV